MNLVKDDLIRFTYDGTTRCGQVIDIDDPHVILTVNHPNPEKDNRVPTVTSYRLSDPLFTDIQVMETEEDKEEVLEELMMVELRYIQTILEDLHSRYPHSSLDDMCGWLNS